MTMYYITMQVNRFLDYAVEAKSEDEALEIIDKDISDHCGDRTDYHTLTVHTIQEITNA